MVTFQQKLDYVKKYSQDLKSKIYAKPKGIIKHPFVMAGCDAYRCLIDWDAVWGASAFVENGDVEPLKNSIINIFEHTHPDGKGERRIDDTGYNASKFTNRPFIVTGAGLVSRRIGVDWISDEMLDNIHNYLMYFHANRVGRFGLLKWLNVDEGFADNGLCNMSWDLNSVEAVDLSSQVYLEHAWACYIMKQKNDSRYKIHQRHMEDLKYRINEFMYNEEDSAYYCIYNPQRRRDKSRFIKVLGYNNLWPLWVGITPEDKAKKIIEKHLLNKDEFLADYGIRSLSKSEGQFNNCLHGVISPVPLSPSEGPAVEYYSSNWQGPVWAPCTYIGITILSRYGYKKEAQELFEKWIDFAYETLNKYGCYYENYREDKTPIVCPGTASWYLLMPYLDRHMNEKYFDEVFDLLK